MQRIDDEFTDRPVSRQRKWALRNPEKAKALLNRYRQNKRKKKESK